MSLEKAIVRLVRQATDERFNEILDAITASKEKTTNSFHNLTTKINKFIMATKADFQAVLGRIDAATNGIASELTELKDKIAGAGLPADQEAEILSALDAAAAKLEGIGKPEAPAGEPSGDTTGGSNDGGAAGSGDVSGDTTGGSTGDVSGDASGDVSGSTGGTEEPA